MGQLFSDAGLTPGAPEQEVALRTVIRLVMAFEPRPAKTGIGRRRLMKKKKSSAKKLKKPTRVGKTKNLRSIGTHALNPQPLPP